MLQGLGIRGFVCFRACIGLKNAILCSIWPLEPGPELQMFEMAARARPEPQLGPTAARARTGAAEYSKSADRVSIGASECSMGAAPVCPGIAECSMGAARPTQNRRIA